MKKLSDNFSLENLKTPYRNKGLIKHISLSFIFKSLVVIFNFLLVPMSIEYLGKTNYGVWLIIASFISWFTFFDIGLEHGLRNRFAEAKSMGKEKEVKAYVSSTYFTLISISSILLILFGILNFFINWTTVFNTDELLANNLSQLMLILFAFFCSQLVLKLITAIYNADQKPSVAVFAQFLNLLVAISFIYGLIESSKEGSLTIYGIIISGAPVIILLLLSVYAFKTRYKAYVPTIKLWKKKYVKGVMGLGVKFFIVQISAVILYSTDNLIITQLFGPDKVVPYNLAFKYFSVITMISSIIVTPFWSAITEAYVKKEYNWIKKSMKNLLFISLLLGVLVIAMMMFANTFYRLWVGDKILVSLRLTILMGLFTIITLIIRPFVFFINGTGKITLQLIVGGLMAVINIPLSILLAKTFDMGIAGVIFATILCSLLGLVFYPLQYRKIINLKDKGIWSK